LNTDGINKSRISLVDAQKAFIMELILDANLDIKLLQENIPGQPSFIKETLRDDSPQGRDLIDALNENEMPLPEIYADMLGITKWQAGLPVYLQKLPEEVTDIPEERNEQINQFIEQYS
jgi:hypothetical protein